MGATKREDGKGETKRVNTAPKREFKMSAAYKRKLRTERAMAKGSSKTFRRVKVRAI